MTQRKSAPLPERHFERGGRANETTSCDLNPAGCAVQPVEALPVIEWCGVRVVTTDTLAKGYGVPENTIRKNLSNNRDRFAEDVHIFTLKGVALTAFRNHVNDIHSVNKHTTSLTLWTERGAARMSKIIDSDQAWDFFEKMEDSYFSRQRNALPGTPDFSDPAAAARAWADAYEEQQRITGYAQRQAKYIDHLENLFTEGLTPVQFCRRLNGVNTSKVNSWLAINADQLFGSLGGLGKGFMTFLRSLAVSDKKNSRLKCVGGIGFTAYRLIGFFFVNICPPFESDLAFRRSNSMAIYRTTEKEKAEGCGPGLWFMPDSDQRSGVSIYGFLRCISLRAISTSARISSLALLPISSIRASASREESRALSALPPAWRRAISPRIAVTINPALLSFPCFTASMPSITSWGMRTVVICDLLFVRFAIVIPLKLTCISLCPEKEKAGDYSPGLWLFTSVDQLSGVSSFAFRRWRRLISPRIAVTINCASLSPFSFTNSTSRSTSRGILAVFCCDLLLVVPVAIIDTPCSRWESLYAKKIGSKPLRCKSPSCIVFLAGDLHLVCVTQKRQSPAGGRTPCRASNHNGTENAMTKANSTTQNFTFLFLATKPGDKCAPTTLRTVAATEEEARAAFPGWNLTFAAKIRTDCPVTCHWIDQDSTALWSVIGTAHDPEEMRRHFTGLNQGGELYA